MKETEPVSEIQARIERRINAKRRIDNLKEAIRTNKELEALLLKDLLSAEQEFNDI